MLREAAISINRHRANEWSLMVFTVYLAQDAQSAEVRGGCRGGGKDIRYTLNGITRAGSQERVLVLSKWLTSILA